MLRGGYQALWQRMAEANGVTVTAGTAVKSIARERDGPGRIVAYATKVGVHRGGSWGVSWGGI
jgi:phytoene dehydrogenase-like protein